MQIAKSFFLAHSLCIFPRATNQQEDCMSKVRVPMKNIKNILYIYLVDQLSMKKIAGRTGIPYSTVYDNIILVKAKDLTWSQLETMSEEALDPDDFKALRFEIK